MTQAKSLLVFIKNPVLGKVKTRLAAHTSNEVALNVYRQLLTHTAIVANKVEAGKIIFHADFIPPIPTDAFKVDVQRYVQEGSDLGERMCNAFRLAFEQGIRKAVLIGSDCAALTTDHVHQAFEKLSDNDVVLGPATDGGYYLLGMKCLHKGLFDGIRWGSNEVRYQTLQRATQVSLTYALLEPLTDIDELKDLATLPAHWEIT